jgi:hypothetical protein
MNAVYADAPVGNVEPEDLSFKLRRSHRLRRSFGMGIGISIFLLALGAILAFAVNVSMSGIDINAVGVILMIVGAIGLATSFLFWDRLGFGGGYRRTATRTYVDDPVVPVVPVATTRRGVVREREIIRDEDVL